MCQQKHEINDCLCPIVCGYSFVEFPKVVGQSLVKVLLDPLDEADHVDVNHLKERVRLNLLQLTVTEVVEGRLRAAPVLQNEVKPRRFLADLQWWEIWL